MGMLTKLNIIWRSHVIWPLCTLSALAGAAITIVVQHILGAK
jgi:hypothetical protein